MAVLGNPTREVIAGNMRNPSAAAEIKAGLTRRRRRISSKFFYDETGSALFHRITMLPEYYLTRSEFQILQKNAGEIAMLVRSAAIGGSAAIFEAGPGDSRKARIVVQALIEAGLETKYAAVDISQSAVDEATESITSDAAMEILGLCGDYHELVPQLSTLWPACTKLLLFLGSSIGNYRGRQARTLLRAMRTSLSTGDLALVGFDLEKDESILVAAYSDNEGITREFNLNILRRINAELGGNFDPFAFRHHAVYNKRKCAMESYLVSMRSQRVRILELDLDLSFTKGEMIHTEDSHKYTLVQIDRLARQSGFRPLRTFMDDKDYFACSLWQAVGEGI